MAKKAESEVPEGAAVFPLIPSELGVNPLLLAVLHAVVFLEGSDKHIVDPAAADEAKQFIAGYLQRLSGPHVQRVREDMKCLAQYARQTQWHQEQLSFLEEFLDDYEIRG